MKATTWQTLAWRDDNHKLEWLVLRCRNHGKIQLIAPLSWLNPPLTNQSSLGWKGLCSGSFRRTRKLFSSQESWVVRWRQERALGDTFSRHLWNRNFPSMPCPKMTCIDSFRKHHVEDWDSEFFSSYMEFLSCKVPRISCLSYTEHKMDRREMLS